MSARILFIVPRFGTIRRGVEVFAAELSGRLAARGYDVSILSGPHDASIASVQMLKFPLLRRELLSSLMRPAIVAKAARRLSIGPAELESASLVRNAKRLSPSASFDVIIPMGGMPAVRFARARWPRARIVCVGQAGAVPKELRYADAFVALTSLDAKIAETANSRLRLASIPNGVDLARFVPNPVPPRQQHLLCAAALEPGKGHEYLFDALFLLPRSVTLTCIGHGSELSSLRRHPAVIGGRVRFQNLSHEQMPRAYQEASAFTLASPEEAFGIVFIEALACGLPVVAHDAPRQREVLGSAGTFVDVRDAQAYAAALLRALEEGPRPEQRQYALRYGWDAIADRYAEFLSESGNSCRHGVTSTCAITRDPCRFS